MVCETKKEAARISYFGAIKMDAQNYVIREFWPFTEQGGQLRRGGYTVRRGLTSYTVEDTDGAEKRTLTCTCPFFRDNAHHGTCKHVQKVEWLLRDREEELAEDHGSVLLRTAPTVIVAAPDMLKMLITLREYVLSEIPAKPGTFMESLINCTNDTIALAFGDETSALFKEAREMEVAEVARKRAEETDKE